MIRHAQEVYFSSPESPTTLTNAIVQTVGQFHQAIQSWAYAVPMEHYHYYTLLQNLGIADPRDLSLTNYILSIDWSEEDVEALQLLPIAGAAFFLQEEFLHADFHYEMTAFENNEHVVVVALAKLLIAVFNLQEVYQIPIVGIDEDGHDEDGEDARGSSRVGKGERDESEGGARADRRARRGQGSGQGSHSRGDVDDDVNDSRDEFGLGEGNRDQSGRMLRRSHSETSSRHHNQPQGSLLSSLPSAKPKASPKDRCHEFLCFYLQYASYVLLVSKTNELAISDHPPYHAMFRMLSLFVDLTSPLLSYADLEKYLSYGLLHQLNTEVFIPHHLQSYDMYTNDAWRWLLYCL